MVQKLADIGNSNGSWPTVNSLLLSKVRLPKFFMESLKDLTSLIDPLPNDVVQQISDENLYAEEIVLYSH